MHFNMPQRQMLDHETTVARVRYFGTALPMEFALCLRMRQTLIQGVTQGGNKADFEVFKDQCSTFLYIPIVMTRAGIVELVIKHASN